MLNRFYDDARTGPALAILFLIGVFSLPCLSPSTEGAGGFMCRVVCPRIAKVADRSTDDPVALFTIVLAISTIGLWLQTKRLAIGAEGQAADTRKQVEIIRDDFVSTHRPWVSFEAKIGPKGIWYDDKGMHIHMLFQCRNSGSTPGIGVSVNATAFLQSRTKTHLQMLEEICQKLAAHPTALQNLLPTIVGTTLFPEGKWTFEKHFIIPKAVVDEMVKGTKRILPIVAGAVDYGFTFGPLESHHTKFILHISKRDPADPTDLTKSLPFTGDDGPISGDAVKIARSSYMRAFEVT